MLYNRLRQAVLFAIASSLAACGGTTASTVVPGTTLNSPTGTRGLSSLPSARFPQSAAPYQYIAPWDGFGRGTEIVLSPYGKCQHIPATPKAGYAWPAMLATLPIGTLVTVLGTPSYADRWSIQNGCPTGGIKASNISAGTATPPPVGLLLPPAGTIYLGARVNPFPTSAPYEQSRVALFEARIHRPIALDNHYYPWDGRFPGLDEADDFAHHRIPVIAWNCKFTDASIAAGAHDGDILAAAANIKAYAHPIFLRWFWEMDLGKDSNGRRTCWDPATDDDDGTFGAANYVAAWKHIHAIFAAQNVTNVVWLWNPSSTNRNNLRALSLFYPGDTQTDWVGFDGYELTAGVGPQQTWGAMYAALSALTVKPILIVETATIASNQAAWLTGADVTLATLFPNVKGIMYYDSTGPRGDWTLTESGSPSGMSAFATFANRPYLGAPAPAFASTTH